MSSSPGSTEGGIFKSYGEMTPDQQVAWKLGYEQAKREAEEALRHDHFCECFECLVTRTLGEE